MATYNGARHIEAQLQSLANQECLPNELIISDDLSTDNTVSLIQEFAKNTPLNIEIFINKERLGYTQNFNNALEKTTGDIIFLSDQDDVWFPKKISTMIDFIHKNPDSLIYMNDALLTDGNLKSTSLTKYNQIKSMGLPDESFIMGCCCAIRRELLEFTLPIPKLIKGHDNWLVGIANILSEKKIKKEPLQYYRRHDNNESKIIVNKLTKTSRITKYLLYINKLKNGDFQENSTQMHYFTEGLKKVMPNSPEKYKNKIKNVINNRIKRISIRKTHIIGRIPKAITFHTKNTKNTKIKSIIRDIIG